MKNKELREILSRLKYDRLNLIKALSLIEAHFKKRRLSEEEIHSAIMSSYCRQRADEEIIDWDSRVFDTRLLAKKVYAIFTAQESKLNKNKP